MMELNSWLFKAIKKLESVGIGSSRLDCLILLEDELKKDRGFILAHPEFVLSNKNIVNLEGRLKRRFKHEPIAYIRGLTEFYGLKFLINKNVLEPRPESETMIDLLLSLKIQKPTTIIDLGTGSGAIAITAKLKFPNCRVIATDIDKKCLVVAKKNCQIHKTNIELLPGNLLEPVNESVDIILANLPYVPDSWKINEAAAMEPRIAIFGGPDGLEIYRQLFNQVTKENNKPVYILTESLPPQHQNLEKIANKNNYKLKKSQDFIQVFKLL